MMTKNADKKREQMMMFSMDDMVPQNHMLRLIDKAINWNFIYDLVEEKYCPEHGYLKGKIRLKKTDEGSYYVVKTVKKINEEEAVEIREKRNLLREKRREKRHQ